MPHAWLLAGPQGLGKRRFADAAARHVLASAAGPAVDESRLDVPDSHPTAHLIEAGSHMDMRVLEREVRERTGDRAPGISIDHVRALQPPLQSTPALSTSSARRVGQAFVRTCCSRLSPSLLYKNFFS